MYCEAGEVIGDSGSVAKNCFQEENTPLSEAEEDEQTSNMTWASAKVRMPEELEAAENNEEDIYYVPGAIINDEIIEAANQPSSCEKVMDKNSAEEDSLDDDVFEY